jgi:hypothetical protein
MTEPTERTMTITWGSGRQQDYRAVHARRLPSAERIRRLLG